MEPDTGAPDRTSSTIPGSQANAVPKALDLLLKVEADVRQLETIGELEFLIANETMRLSRCRQAFVLAEKAGRFQVRAVTAIGAVDRNVPRIRWVEAVVALLKAGEGLQAPRDFSRPAFCPPGDPESGSFPYPFMAWLPFALRDGRVFGGMLLVRDIAWSEADLVIARRLAATYAHAWAALAGERKLRRGGRKPWLWIAASIACGLVGLMPVPMMVLAPAELVPVGAHIIAAPLDGVIESIAVDPDQAVKAGDRLVKMSDVVLRNDLAVSEQDVKVAEARVMQVTQGAMADPKLRAELSIVRSELTVATTKRDYARDLLARTDLAAPADGVVIYTDRSDWIGRPVTTGERIMEVADPRRMQLRIDVPVADAMAVSTGAEVRAFLDSDPLRPALAKVVSASFEARMIEGDILAYRIYATLDAVPEGLRLGIRGTAQISGKKVALAYYLFRKPIAVLRQRFGL
ncbi:efflux RND transporter periplasmic adaptor subunit [Pararhizobium sp.]|uniref:efflux RND transporter periplasmic adaptor subunit n=1 Tax=Pararhizobium sp. TaxID=1977563 RepID=UPI00271775BD|nr:HlyD family efflux transporter periplasmic adaptor subunit [Pararhizobium sp.]MDO9417174.1 HlyD family efflux transporter periplasmic adaptor subunit [Pararhizobium sp.]